MPSCLAENFTWDIGFWIFLNDFFEVYIDLNQNNINNLLSELTPCCVMATSNQWVHGGYSQLTGYQTTFQDLQFPLSMGDFGPQEPEIWSFEHS